MPRNVFLVYQNEENKSRLTEVEGHLKRAGANYSWLGVSIGEKLDLKSYYVIDPMKGELCDFLLREKCKVFGSAAIITSLSLKLSLVGNGLLKKSHTFGGVASIAMMGLTICFTNIRKVEREKLAQLCRQMGARVSSELSHNVSHLVVGEVMSNKYVVASEEGIKTVTKDWIEYLWNLSVEQQQPIAPNKLNFDEVCSSFECRVFHGCTICCTNIDSEEKETISTLVGENGGQYTTSMDKYKCTHLIVGESGGDKHKYALEWGINVVTRQWIYDSVKLGFLTTRPKYSVAKPESLCIEVSTEVPSELDEDLIGLAQNVHGFELLEEMCFYLSGFEEYQKRQLDAIIRNNGGFMMDKFSSSITHVIMNESNLENDPDVKNYETMFNSSCFVIKFQWLKEAIEAGEAPDESQFLIFPKSIKTAQKPIHNNSTFTDCAMSP